MHEQIKTRLPRRGLGAFVGLPPGGAIVRRPSPSTYLSWEHGQTSFDDIDGLRAGMARAMDRKGGWHGL